MEKPSDSLREFAWSLLIVLVMIGAKLAVEWSIHNAATGGASW